MAEWYYMRGETQFGPISGVMLHGLIQRGRLQGDTRVRRSDMAEWSTAAEVLPSLPPIPESPPPPAEQLTNAQPFDSSLPGASVVYAPPQATLVVLSQPGQPAALWIGTILCSVALVFELTCWATLALIHLSYLVEESLWPEWLKMLATWLTHSLGMNHVIFATAISKIATAIWQGCAFSSLKKLYGGVVRRSRASGLWWFVPVANLFMPLRCLRDMRHLSRKRREIPNLHAPFGPLLITLEVLILIRFPIGTIEGLSARSRPMEELGNVTAMQVVLDFAIMGFSCTLLMVVIANFLQQKRLYSHWNDDAYWQKPQNR